jgi:hypothetical protein
MTANKDKKGNIVTQQQNDLCHREHAKGRRGDLGVVSYIYVFELGELKECRL